MALAAKKDAAVGHAPDLPRAVASIVQKMNRQHVILDHIAASSKRLAFPSCFTTSTHMGENLPAAGATVLTFAAFVQ